MYRFIIILNKYFCGSRTTGSNRKKSQNGGGWVFTLFREDKYRGYAVWLQWHQSLQSEWLVTYEQSAKAQTKLPTVLVQTDELPELQWPLEHEPKLDIKGHPKGLKTGSYTGTWNMSIASELQRRENYLKASFQHCFSPSDTNCGFLTTNNVS